jgi:hypothetical protein
MGRASLRSGLLLIVIGKYRIYSFRMGLYKIKLLFLNYSTKAYNYTFKNMLHIDITLHTTVFMKT